VHMHRNLINMDYIVCPDRFKPIVSQIEKVCIYSESYYSNIFKALSLSCVCSSRKVKRAEEY
jgi:hypothetical protein